MADVLRSQVAAQLDSGSTNDLESVGILGAGLAFAVALMIIRATHGNDPTWYWWWYPLPALLGPAVVVAVPLLPPKPGRRFTAGPDVPWMLAGFTANPQTLEQMLEAVVGKLRAALVRNDRILAREETYLKWGIRLFSLVTLVTIGLYTWGLR
jgi:hypothetical protein